MTQTWVSSFHRASSQGVSLPTIATLNPLPQAFINSPYSAPLTAFGGIKTYVWSLLAATGTNFWGISGSNLISLTNPVNPETDLITIGLKDGAGNSAPNVTYRLVVNPVLTPLWPDPLPSGRVGQFYTYTLTAQFGVPPYTFGLQAGFALPVGLTLNGATGVISGTPTVPVTFLAENFTVTDSSP